jgi:hypothetical protein
MTEIAADESGYEGQRLIGATTDVFAHGSVDLSADVAADCMSELRRRIQSPATEYKATHLLRRKHRKVLEWLLAEPVDGRGHVFLIDKAFYVVNVAATVLHADPAIAATVCRAGRTSADSQPWEAFLAAANNLLRTKDLPDTVDAFYSAVDRLDLPGPAAGALEVLSRTKAQAEEYRARLLAAHDPVPALDPLLPAIIAGTDHWSSGSEIVMVPDRQTTLSPSRIAYLRTATSGRLADLRLVDSFYDPRVQLADVLAGVARKIASDELNGRGDPGLTGLLRPYVNRRSIWGDELSWASLVG